MTLSATCATGKVSPIPSYYRAEQYDSDLGLYYLRARYYNPLTGRFMSRDPEDGDPPNPASLHKYLYAQGDPVNAMDPTGSEAMFQYAAFTRSRAQTAAIFGFKTDMCLNAGLVGISDALNADMNGGSIPANDQQLAGNLGTCEAKAIKGLLGMLLNFATR